MRARVAVIINSGAGTAESDSQRDLIRHTFDDAGMDAKIFTVEPGKDLEKLTAEVVQSDVEFIVAAGGDGTISGVVNQLIGTRKTLGVLPLGTLNHFSKDLQIPQDLVEAIRIIADGVVRVVDVGEVNGRYFINNSSIGLYPRIVRKRKQQEHLGRGKWWAAAWAAWRFMWVSPFLKVKLELEDNELRRKTPFVFVGNNEYEMDLYNIGRRLRLDNGQLSVYLLHRSGRTGLFLLVVRTLLGMLGQAKDFEEFRTRSLTIETRRKRMLVAYDGEIDVMETPLEYRIHPKSLQVLVPSEA
jgi:YegS/Rv2252/BmrU family lipid kinase